MTGRSHPEGRPPRRRSRVRGRGRDRDGGRGRDRGGGGAGQSTVELALLLPILAIGVLVVVQVARVASDRVAVHHAAREAARSAAVDPTPGRVSARAARATPELRPERLRVELGPQRIRGDLIEVRAVYRSPTDVPVVGRLIGDIELSATAVVRIE